MLKSLYPQINWQLVKVVGFDMDGTLYDEFQFIKQVYRPISQYLASICKCEKEQIYVWMVKRWLEKGSSYNHIFQEVLDLYGPETNDADNIIKECLKLYRGFLPKLSLPIWVRWLLYYFKRKDYKLFIITDGNYQLQLAKLRSLGLERWIEPEDIAISGCFGIDYQKPSLAMTNKIKLLQTNILPEEVVYFGDREVDKLFASQAGFQFIKVHCLIAKG